MIKTKRVLAFLVGFVVASLVARWVIQYLRSVCSQVEMETVTVPPRRQAVPSPPAAPKPPETPAPAALNLNTADIDALIALPGVGPALAERIVAQRERSAFTSVDDLVQVPGIGPALLDRLRPDVTV